MHMQWRSNGYRDECQALEVDRKVGGQTRGKEQAFKTDKQKQKNKKQNKTKTKGLSPSDTETCQSQIRFQFLLSTQQQVAIPN